jgi:hypothetical protein
MLAQWADDFPRYVAAGHRIVVPTEGEILDSLLVTKRRYNIHCDGQ